MLILIFFTRNFFSKIDIEGLHVRLESPGVLGPTMGVLAARLAAGPPCPLLLEAAVLLASPHLSTRPLIQHKTFMEAVSQVKQSGERGGQL